MGPTDPGNPTPDRGASSADSRRASSRTKALVWIALLAVAAVAVWALLRSRPAPPAAKPEAEAAKPGAAGLQEPDVPGVRPDIRKTAQSNAAPYAGLRGPRGAALDGDGRLWVADFGTSRLFLFDPQGGFLGGWGGEGNGKRQFAHPFGVAIHGDTLYVADTENSRVTAYSLAGDWKASSPGLYGPRGVAVAPDGTVWVTDIGNRRLVRYDAQLSRPESLGKTEKGLDLRAPIGIAVGRAGLVYVSDPDDHSLKIVDADGNFQSRVAVPTWGPNSEPYLASGPGDTLLATDPLVNAVFQLNRSGKETRRWTKDERGQPFSNPTGIAWNEKTQAAYVVNTGTNSVTRIDLSAK